MNIKQFSINANISPFTLRYYEKIGLLNKIIRDESGRRIYTASNLDEVKLISELKEFGMDLNQIAMFLSFNNKVRNSAEEKIRILVEQRASLVKQINAYKVSLSKLDARLISMKHDK
ncbi:MerR family transcriptional regulator [Tolumonas lignilytica]|uniref:MerR family transcriptional regulator n=1 Tax=Tolumonas lignilytica TaxID=1283284 RepID=UPI0004665D64|nr:MerR family transcriptional regulator [Tolumonas lignilytica]